MKNINKYLASCSFSFQFGFVWVFFSPFESSLDSVFEISQLDTNRGDHVRFAGMDKESKYSVGE